MPSEFKQIKSNPPSRVGTQDMSWMLPEGKTINCLSILNEGMFVLASKMTKKIEFPLDISISYSGSRDQGTNLKCLTNERGKIVVWVFTDLSFKLYTEKNEIFFIDLMPNPTTRLGLSSGTFMIEVPWLRPIVANMFKSLLMKDMKVSPIMV